MTATSVASSSQMFGATSFGQPTRSTSPAINPFASPAEAQGGASGFGGASDSNRTKRNKRNGRASDQSDNEGKNKFANPFKALGGGGNKQRTDKPDGKKKFGDVKKNPFGQSDPSMKPRPQNAREGNTFNPFATRRSQSPLRPTSSSSTESTHFRSQQLINENDPHAKKVYQQLRKDGISPPPWPSQPGNPQNKAEMAKFREKYEAYRDKVRASLTKAGLIDDPTKRKTLQDAIDFKGICEDMCPDYEKITRITEMDVHQPEKSSKTTWANSRHMVKKLARSAAGQEAPLPMDVRSVPALRRTLDYLIDRLLRHDGRLPTLHGFLWDRTRAIRRDFTFFSSLTPDEIKLQVYVLENIARFHVTSLHLLSQEGEAPEDFVEQQELEQLGKCLLSLRDTYDDCNEQGITCENEPEFRAYYLLFHGYDPNILESLQRQWKPSLWRDSDEVRTAVSLVEALQNTQDFHGPLKDAPSLAASAAYNSYFRIIEDPSVSYTMACFAECHFPHLRRSILNAVKLSLARPKGTTKDVTAEVLNKFLRFDSIEQAISFAELHDLDFAPGEKNPSDPSQQYLILDNRKPLPHRRLKHQFSRSLVEKKRGSRPLPDLIHESVLEDPNAINTAINGTGEDSLFVSDAEVPQNSVPIGSKAPATINPFSPFGPSSGGSGTSSAATDKPGITPNGILPSSGSPFQQPAQATSPFAPNSTSTTQSNPQNPFASTPSSSTTPSTGVPLSGSGPSGNPPLSFNPFAQKSRTDPDPIRPRGPVSAFNPFASTQSSQTVKEQPPNPSAPSFSFLTEQKPVSDTTGTLLGQTSESKPSEPTVPKSSESASAQPPAINIIPPPTQTAASPFTVPPTTTSSFSSILGGTSTQQLPPTKPSIGAELSKPPLPPAVPEIKPVPAAIPSVSTTSTPQFSFPTSTTPSQEVSTSTPAPTQSALGLSTAKTSQPAEFSQPTYAPKLSSPPIQPPAPPRDLIGDFTSWFVKGDEGLLADFQAFMLDNILQEVYRKFEKDEAKKRQQEEEERAIAEANNFRVYSLSVKYFYRWRDNARELRLRNLRRSGRDQMRQYYEAQRATELEAQKKAARQAARERAELENLDRPEELRDLMRHKVSRRQAEDDLLASGVLSGMDNEREVIAKIVRKPPSINGSTTSAGSKLSQSTSRGGAKTQALRQQLLGGRARSSSFRRSLPPMPSREAASPESGNRQSKVSERWRLKAMGIVQLPDGTALPEALANERYKKSQATVGSMGPPNGTSIRRASIAGLERPGTQRTLSASDTRITPSIEDASAKNKRKRVTEDDGETNKDTTSKTHSHKRVMSDAANLMSELRAMRAEMEESASWFKHQNERLQSEIVSRGSTPWDQDA